ncbi:MinD/ParA family ATP-binding protein [Microbacterium sp. SA39]|uniref:MinD/ParA family ATP-binding protein n=1 Tax=Microbacterium sp. SA39 TaxID=1263625 RepID=UPI00061E41E4|nr:AAA family ATPase [Microbacterium sp. SA39]KJQ55985.1 hypothetical protein RS85_00189 [Microbacterium sp. SA39]
MSGPHENTPPADSAPTPQGGQSESIINSIPPMPSALPPVPPMPDAPAADLRSGRASAPAQPEPVVEETWPNQPAPQLVEPPQYHRSSVTPPAEANADPAPPTRRQQRELQGRQSFLLEERPEEPAREGVRGAINKLGFKMAPDAAEQSARNDELSVSQHWPGPRTIAVVNGKGGAGKTPSTILLSAVFARYGGAGVLAWDNNQTRGTLGWRTEAGTHDRTLLEMLPESERLLGTGAQSADLAHFVHHQPREKFDVLRSKPIRLAHENRLHPEDVDAIHAVAAKFYRLIIIDSGNDESDPMWLRMIDHADQLVVATTTRADHAEAGALLLEALEERDERSARLADQAVVVVSQADPKASAADVEHVVGGYRSLAREVVSIPFDHEMVDGHLRFGALAKRTQRAWLSAAAAVARGL